jgi:hypothetical protein
MSSDPTRPLPPPEWNPEGQQRPGDTPTRAEPVNRPRPTFTPNPQQPPYQPPQQSYEGYQAQQRAYEPQQQTYQYEPQYNMAAPGSRPRRRRRRWPIVTGIIVIVLLGLAVAADRVACVFAENDMASQVQQNGFPVKPHVSIEGFPFLTQLAAKDFNNVVITASNVTEGSLTIASITANLHGMHLIDGYSGARIDTIDGTALVTFGALANAGSLPSAVTLGPGPDPNEIQVSALGTSVADAQVSRTGTNKFYVSIKTGGGLSSLIGNVGNIASFTVNVPDLPAGVQIQSVAVTHQGVQITITGHNTTLTEN